MVEPFRIVQQTSRNNLYVYWDWVTGQATCCRLLWELAPIQTSRNGSPQVRRYVARTSDLTGAYKIPMQLIQLAGHGKSRLLIEHAA